MNSFLKISSVTLLLGLSFLSHGQDPADFKTQPSGDMIARWLRGRDPREMAWAAAFALQERDTSFLSEMASLAEQWQPLPYRSVLEHEGHLARSLTQEEQAQRDAVAALLDAIIQLDGSLPAASLERLVNDFPAQAVILLSRMPSQETESTLLAVYGEKAPASWYSQRAAASLLALHPPAGFSASLLTNTTVKTFLHVSLPEDSSIVMGKSSTDCVSYPQPRGRATWPETGKYFLRDSGHTPQAYLTIPGLRPIDAVRVVNTNTLQTDSGECTGFTPLNDTIRVALLAEMLGLDQQRMAIMPRNSVNLKVKGEQDYEAKLAAYVDAEETGFQEVKMRLLAKQLLSPAEAVDNTVVPTLSLVLSDGRSAKGFSLRQVRSRYAKVDWEAQSSGDLYE